MEQKVNEWLNALGEEDSQRVTREITAEIDTMLERGTSAWIDDDDDESIMKIWTLKKFQENKVNGDDDGDLLSVRLKWKVNEPRKRHNKSEG